jgi:hypothetical protein
MPPGIAVEPAVPPEPPLPTTPAEPPGLPELEPAREPPVPDAAPLPPLPAARPPAPAVGELAAVPPSSPSGVAASLLHAGKASPQRPSALQARHVMYPCPPPTLVEVVNPNNLNIFTGE